jgi:hypothetical protein
MATATYEGGTRVLTWITTLTFGVALVVAFAAPAAAKPIRVPPNFFTNTFAAGERCEFALRTVTGGGIFVERELIDKDGNLVETVRGVQNTLTITNLDNNKTFTLQGKGFSRKSITNPDGTVTSYVTGHILFSLSPTDVPAGPAFLMVVGRIVSTEAAGVFTVQETHGRTVDLCALVN